MKPEGRRLTTVAKAKGLSLDINCTAEGEGVERTEANSSACEGVGERSNRRVCRALPGSKTIVGNQNVDVGTWDGLYDPKENLNKLKKQGEGKRYR